MHLSSLPLALAASALLAACATSTPPAPPASASASTSFTFTPIRPAELLERVRRSPARAVLLDVWATWCDPCKAELPELVRLSRKYAPEGLELVLVSVDFERQRPEAERFLRELGVDRPAFVRDGTDEELIDALGAGWGGALPATFYYRRGGALFRFTEGEVPPEALEAEVRAVLGLQP